MLGLKAASHQDPSLRTPVVGIRISQVGPSSAETPSGLWRDLAGTRSLILASPGVRRNAPGPHLERWSAWRLSGVAPARRLPGVSLARREPQPALRSRSLLTFARSERAVPTLPPTALITNLCLLRDVDLIGATRLLLPSNQLRRKARLSFGKILLDHYEGR